MGRKGVQNFVCPVYPPLHCLNDSISPVIIPPAQQSCWGGILVSLRPSVRPSVRPCLREHMHWLLFVYIEHQLDTFCLLDIPNNPVCWTCLYWLLKSHYAKYPFGHGCSPCVREMAVHPLPTVLIAHSKVFPLVASWPVRNGCLVNRHRGEIFHYHGHVISHSETTRC